MSSRPRGHVGRRRHGIAREGEGYAAVLGRHERAVEALAGELHRELSEVQRVYQLAYPALESQARVMDYLPLFVVRRTRALLPERRA